MTRLCALVLAAAVAGCATVEQVKDAQGSGEKRLYQASIKQVSAAILRALQSTGGEIDEFDAVRCRAIAHYGARGPGFGERVGVFCYVISPAATDVEIVLRRGVTVGGLVTNWDAQIFAALERELRR